MIKRKKPYPRRFIQKDYDDGFEARKRLVKREDNPYKNITSFAHYSWDRGWSAANELYGGWDVKC